jgi:ribonuclease D
VKNDSLPPARAWAERNAEADARLKAAREAVGTLSEELNIPLENLLTPDTLRRVAWTPPEPLSESGVRDALAGLGARPWQIDASAQLILNAFVDPGQASGEAEESPS